MLGLVPIRMMLRMFFFSEDFGDKMVYPLIALILGRGDQTANVACAILERLFDDLNMNLRDYDPDILLPNLPTMVTFPKLDQFGKDWVADLRSKGADIQLDTDVTAVSRSKAGVTLQTANVYVLGPKQRPRPMANLWCASWWMMQRGCLASPQPGRRNSYLAALVSTTTL
jgi:hypothetical protein